MTVCEIYINRRGINTIEVPKEVEVTAGDKLILKFINLGHPTHLSISAVNSHQYTSFIQENLYISDVLDYEIPIKDGPYAGVFDMEIITGYSTKKAVLKVNVMQKCEPELPKIAKSEVKKGFSLQESPILVPGSLFVVGLLLYIMWLSLRSSAIKFPVDALNIAGFIAVLVAVPLAWYYRP